MSNEHLYASFLLDKQSGLEIALQAEQVLEATPLITTILPLPNSVDFIEGFMPLRNDVLPVINLKKRFGLSVNQYDPDAKVAVIHLRSRRYGLLFDDIREVLRVPEHCVEEIDPVLSLNESMISALIKLNDGTRTLELLNIENLFLGDLPEPPVAEEEVADKEPVQSSTLFRYVVFRCEGQEFGIPVEAAREICFLSAIDDTFQSGVVEGALQLRGHTIPVLNGHHLLASENVVAMDDKTRVLVMQTGDLLFGIIVDQICEIIITPEEDILPMPGHDNAAIRGVCQYAEKRNIMLLDVARLLDTQLERVKSMAKLHDESEEEMMEQHASAYHLITENCYLIFSIGKNFAVELKDVQEILETTEILTIPGNDDLIQGVINLRGIIVPVLDLHQFYSCQNNRETGMPVKLIIGQAGGQRVALVVDEIVTIYKQEEFHETPSLRPELQQKKDTLDRLIEFIDNDDLKEHVLVVNIKNILRNHLHLLEGNTEDGGTEQESTAVSI